MMDCNPLNVLCELSRSNAMLDEPRITDCMAFLSFLYTAFNYSA